MSDDLVRRLRGQYAMGPHMPNGNPEFGWRQFEAPLIQHDAADRIEALEAENARLREALTGLVDALDAVDREAERADQPGATAWSSAPVVALRYKRLDARAALGGDT